MKQVSVFLIVLLIAISIVGCENASGSYDDFYIIKYYQDIPDITDDEIQAIEAVKKTRTGFSYGSLIGTELFVLPDGTYVGFTSKFCDLLTELFGIEFNTLLYEWDELTAGIDDMSIDFMGELTPTQERMQTYFMSHPIAEHAIRIFTEENFRKIENESDVNGLKIGFLENSITAGYIRKAYPDIHFMEVGVDGYKTAAEMMLKKEIDAFIEDSDADPAFDDYDSIISRKLFPLVYTPISMLTANPELEPFIAVINKYLAAGGIDILLDLYNEGEDEYAKYKLNNSFTDEEREYINVLNSNGGTVKVAYESVNYPVNFYNSSEKEFQGIAVDILTEVSRLTGLEFENIAAVSTNWANVMQKLVDGDVQMVTQLLYSDSRKDDFIWTSVPYCTAYYALLSKVDYPELSNYQVLRRKVGYTIKSAQADVYNDWFPDNSNTVGFNNLYEGMDALEAGEIDLYMSSEYALLNQVNFREKSGYKINILLTTPMESFFGFNKNETVLRSIIDKVQRYVNTDIITRNWTGKTFDYAQKAANERSNYFMIFTLLMFVLLVMSVTLLLNNRRAEKRLEELVKNRTQELEKKTTTLSTIYEAIPDIVFSMDANLIYTSCNLSFEKFAGLSEDDIVGKGDPDVFGLESDMAKFFTVTNEKVLREQTTEVVEEVVTYHDGSEKILETVKTPLIQNGKLTGLLGIGRDVTERKAAEEAAKVASKAKSDFLAHMSHEIRTPLNAIIGMAGIAKASISDKVKVLSSIEQITTSSQHLLGILNDVLDMSKIESDKLVLAHESFSLLEACNEVKWIISQRCAEKNINFITNIDEIADVMIVGDKLRLKQVLINLLGNAVKFTGNGSEIKFDTEIEDMCETVRIKFTISDKGIGMSPEQIGKLFIPFEQADSSIAIKFGGTGLGLSISQNLINMMGGVIEVESELNVGSKFFFEFCPEKGTEPSENRVEEPRLVNLKGRRILLAEDIEINRIIICENLSPTEVEIDEAENGQQAIDMFAGSPIDYYDLIFMDVQMPIIGGYEATRKIRSLERPDAKRVPIIAMTAHAYKEDIDQALASGMNSHLSKPINVEALMKELEKLV